MNDFMTASMQDFKTRVFGKWILSGEHAVLRGSPALVFPLYSCFLEFEFYKAEKKSELELDLLGQHGEEMRLLFWSVLDRACKMCEIRKSDLSGAIKIKSTIPVGAGLGASAALCVALGRWFLSLKLIQETEIYEFARSLENLFHGESSGVDIAVALCEKGLKFVRDGDRVPLALKWTPRWYLSYSGRRGVTVECVDKVKRLIEANWKLGSEIDNDMRRSVDLCLEALRCDETEGTKLLAEALKLGACCFERWGLSSPEHEKELYGAGAIAVKSTGSGGGGYLLSLWTGEPKEKFLRERLIPCF